MAKKYNYINVHDLLKKFSEHQYVKKVHYRTEVFSTNDFAKTLVHLDKPDYPQLVVADKQTKGRGRFLRKWESPVAENIYTTWVMKTIIPLQYLPSFTLAVAVAIIGAIQQETGIKLQVKWPNDIMYEQKKVGGILTEFEAVENENFYLIVGIGLNTNMAIERLSTPLQKTATSLYEITQKNFDRLNLLYTLCKYLGETYDEFKETGLRKFKNVWLRLCPYIGKKIKIVSGNTSFEGIAYSIGEDGAFILKFENGNLQSFYSGEITLLE